MSFAKEVNDLLDKRLVIEGFRRKRGRLMKQINNETFASIGLGRTSYPDSQNSLVSIFVTLGVHFESINNVGGELGVYPEPIDRATLFLPLRYLVPEEARSDYDFRPDSNNGLTFDRLISDVKEYGYPFFEAVGTIDQAMYTIQLNLYPELSGTREFVPLVYIFRGDMRESLRLARATLSTMDVKRGNGPRWLQFVSNLENRAAMGN
jgi:hypothetical protein